MPDRTVTVALDARLAAFVQRLVDEGAHPDAAAVLRAALAEYEATGAADAEGVDLEGVSLEDLEEVVRLGRQDIEQGRSTVLSSPADLQALFDGIWSDACRQAAETGDSRRRA